MLTFLPSPSLFAATPATITLAMTCQEEGRRGEESRGVKHSGSIVREQLQSYNHIERGKKNSMT